MAALYRDSETWTGRFRDDETWAEATLFALGSGTLALQATLGISGAITINVESTTFSLDAPLELDLVASIGIAGGLLIVTPDLTGSSAIDFALSGTLDGDAPLVAAPSQVAFTMTATAIGDGALAGASMIEITGTGALSADGAIAGNVIVSFTNIVIMAGYGELAGSSSVMFMPSGTIEFPGVMLQGTAELAFAPVGTLMAFIKSDALKGWTVPKRNTTWDIGKRPREWDIK